MPACPLETAISRYAKRCRGSSSGAHRHPQVATWCDRSNAEFLVRVLDEELDRALTDVASAQDAERLAGETDSVKIYGQLFDWYLAWLAAYKAALGRASQSGGFSPWASFSGV
ncbi:MAG: hypothetical protein U5O39_03375 [Gammaproteobacteria bacterium]|nr:hypothetical protein [Gammaproteobacteria bacterium]